MRILFLGDLIGRAGRDAAAAALPALRRDWKLDFVIANAENAAAGYGLTGAIADELFAAGADVLTLGDHAFDQREMLTHIEREPRILRPLNLARKAPGRGAGVFAATRGRRVFVAVALGRVFMSRPVDDFFPALEAETASAPLGAACDASVIEIHAEATSEKTAVGRWCDGKASLVVGSHTHVPTADARILDRGTAYQTDAGMCGDYNSVIGMDGEDSLKRFVTGMGGGRFAPASGPVTLCGVLVETDDTTGLAVSVAPVRAGGLLTGAGPGPG